jgi:hypothetical protein
MRRSNELSEKPAKAANANFSCWKRYNFIILIKHETTHVIWIAVGG